MIKKLLIIDDDPLTQRMLAMTVNRHQFAEQVSTLPNGKEGIDYFDALAGQPGPDTPDLVFLDINMPVMNGWNFLDEYTKRYEKQFPFIKICILTSSNDPADSERAFSYSSVLMFIRKPVSIEEITKLKSHQTLSHFFENNNQ